MSFDISPLTLGFSPCPNDTFIFNALASGLVCGNDLSFSNPLLEDVETLNELAIEGRLDVTKLSFHALGHCLDKYVLLRTGSALGRGCGPILIGRNNVRPEELLEQKIAIPGKLTTAAMLLKLYNPSFKNLVPMRFDEIIPSVVEGRVDAGLIIHESRFTYKDYALSQIVDLGQWWEESTGLPIPLGGIAAKREIGIETIRKIEKCIRESIKHAFSHPDHARGYIRMHAQEMDDSIIDQHISLYVNDFSIDLGDEGSDAVRKFFEISESSGLFQNIPEDTPIFI